MVWRPGTDQAGKGPAWGLAAAVRTCVKVRI